MRSLEHSEFRVRIVEWGDARRELVRIRTAVFVEEQRVPPELELDGLDADCVHALAEARSAAATTMSGASTAIGAGRLMRDGRIGRMAVLAPWRGRGVGTAILLILLEEARRRGMAEAYLHAQQHAQHFYARHGFVVTSEEYEEAGIAHVEMRRKL